MQVKLARNNFVSRCLCVYVFIVQFVTDTLMQMQLIYIFCFTRRLSFFTYYLSFFWILFVGFFASKFNAFSCQNYLQVFFNEFLPAEANFHARKFTNDSAKYLVHEPCSKFKSSLYFTTPPLELNLYRFGSYVG